MFAAESNNQLVINLTTFTRVPLNLTNQNLLHGMHKVLTNACYLTQTCALLTCAVGF